MSRSSGGGSPIIFKCPKCRRTSHDVRLTGRKKPKRPNRGCALGVRSSYPTREYVCPCGHEGWSNHVDLARRAGEDRTA